MFRRLSSALAAVARGYADAFDADAQPAEQEDAAYMYGWLQGRAVRHVQGKFDPNAVRDAYARAVRTGVAYDS